MSRRTRTLSLGLAGLVAVGALAVTAVPATAADRPYAPVDAIVPTLVPLTIEPTSRYTIRASALWCWDDSGVAEDDDVRTSPALVSGFSPRTWLSAGAPSSDAAMTAWIADGDSVHYYGTSAACNAASGVHGDADGAWDLATWSTPPSLLEQYTSDPGDGAIAADGSWWKLRSLENVDGGAAPTYVFQGDRVLGPFTRDAAPERIWYGNLDPINPMKAPNPGSTLWKADSSRLAIADPGLSVLREVCVVDECDVAVDAHWAKDVTVPDGSTVHWRTTVSNTGNVALRDLVVPHDDTSGAEFPATLAVGDTVVLGYTTASLSGATEGYTSPATASANLDDPTLPGAFAPGHSIGERYAAAATAEGRTRALTATDEATARTPVPPVTPEIEEPELPGPETPGTAAPVPTTSLALSGPADSILASAALGAALLALGGVAAFARRHAARR